MSEPTKMIVQLTVAELDEIIERAVVRALSGNGQAAEQSRLLSPDEAAAIIGVNKAWLFRHGKRLPFTRKLSRKNIRYDEAGLRRWLAARR
jgi:predicted DNA-binding transcriptional regulator AlpA